MSEVTFPDHTAAARGLACCHVCRKVAPVEQKACARCGAVLHLRNPNCLQRTVALTLGAALLYLPANLLPVMTVETLTGGAKENTILGGVVTFWNTGSYPVAIIIFTASVVIPILKILALLSLCCAARNNRRAASATKVYRLTELVGRWSMVDVFVVAILVAVVQLDSLMSISPGPAALAFSGVVILSMLASHSFDQRLIWDVTRPYDDDRQENES